MRSANVPFGSHGYLQPSESKPLLEALDRVHASCAATDESFPVPQAHSEILVRSVVDSTVGFGSFGVLSGVCLAYRLASEACTLSEKPDFKIDRAPRRSGDVVIPGEGRILGDSFCASCCGFTRALRESWWPLDRLGNIALRRFPANILTSHRFYHGPSRWEQISRPFKC